MWCAVGLRRFEEKAANSGLETGYVLITSLTSISMPKLTWKSTVYCCTSETCCLDKVSLDKVKSVKYFEASFAGIEQAGEGRTAANQARRS